MARIKLKYVNAFANRGRKDKRVRYYFRRRGGKAMPLPGLPGSEELARDGKIVLVFKRKGEMMPNDEPNEWDEEINGADQA